MLIELAQDACTEEGSVFTEGLLYEVVGQTSHWYLVIDDTKVISLVYEYEILRKVDNANNL